LIEIAGLTKRYGKITALDNVGLKFGEKGLNLIAGANGAGKTTMLLLIAGLIRQSAGKIRIRSKKIGMYVQGASLCQNRTVRENLMLYSRHDLLAYKSGLTYFESAGLSQLLDKKVHELSSSCDKASYVLIAFSGEPDILLLDEPIAGLDPVLADKIIHFIKDYAKKKLLIMSSQSLRMANLASGRIIVLHNGLVVLDSDITKLRDENHTMRVVMEKAGHIVKIPGVFFCVNGNTIVFKYKKDLSSKIIGLLAHKGIKWLSKGNDIEQIVAEIIRKRENT